MEQLSREKSVPPFRWENFVCFLPLFLPPSWSDITVSDTMHLRELNLSGPGARYLYVPWWGPTVGWALVCWPTKRLRTLGLIHFTSPTFSREYIYVSLDRIRQRKRMSVTMNFKFFPDRNLIFKIVTLQVRHPSNAISTPQIIFLISTVPVYGFKGLIKFPFNVCMVSPQKWDNKYRNPYIIILQILSSLSVEFPCA